MSVDPNRQVKGNMKTEQSLGRHAAKHTQPLRSFVEDFIDGCEMWTSEDGTLVAIAVMDSAEWRDVLRKQFAHIWAHEKFNPARAIRRYAWREWVGSEFFDGPGPGQRRGKVWRVGDEPTAFPVMYYELEKPR